MVLLPELETSTTVINACDVPVPNKNNDIRAILTVQATRRHLP
jgi:hypothetical protein